MNVEGTNGKSNGDALANPSDPFARGVWVYTNLNGFAALVLVDGSEGREEAVAESMMEQLKTRRYARVDLRRKYMLKEIVFPTPIVNGRRTDRLFPGSLPSSGRHGSTLELAHEFVTHATLRTLSFLDWFDPEDVEMLRESVVNADASANDLSRSLRPGAVHPSLTDPFADGFWFLGETDGTDTLICIEGGDEPTIRESDLLEELEKYGGICFNARRKYLLKEILFPQPSGDPFDPLKPMNLPSSGRHETTLDLIHPFNTLTTIDAITFLGEFHPDDVQRLRAWIHYADGQAEEKAVQVRMRRSRLIVPSQNTIVP